MIDGHSGAVVYFSDRSIFDINPVDCGWEHCRPGHHYGPTVRDYYLVHYIFSGNGTFKNSRGEYKLGPGELFIIRPGELTYYAASETSPWHYGWIGLRGGCTSVFDGSPDVMSADLQKYFDALREAVELDTMREEFVAGQILLILTELFAQKSGGRTHIASFAARAAHYIDYHYMQPLSVEQLARDMNIDRRYLSRLFKREYGITMQEYIVSARMKHAEKFLIDGYSVGQTAGMTGYIDVFNFSKMFKKHFGYSPSRCGEMAEGCK